MLNGIDISSWQKGISISSVPSDFVIVKATEGTGYISPNMKEQADETVAAGKLLGFFHFARTNDACKEADFFIDTVSDYLPNAALFLDYEADALNNGPTWAYKFLERVKERTEQLPGIYMSKNVSRNQNWTKVAAAGYPLWMAQYANYNSMSYTNNPWTDSYGCGAWDAPIMHQYTSNGYLDGYSKNLDLDLFYGDEEDWISTFYGGETMNFHDVWFGDTLNSSKTPAEESETSPANLLWETAGEVNEVKTSLAELAAKVDNLQVSSASVDYDKLADLVCDKLSKRLQS